MAQQAAETKLLSQRNRRKAVAATLAIALMTSGATSVQANFADDWVSQTSSTDAGYFSGSKRGYFSGGSFSARFPQSNDNLLTISKPSIKSGCGGIDMFLGGFSFLNVDMLVQKLQNILSAAPAAAFDIALKTLAPQVSDTIKSLEAIVDKLNNLQLDDCKAAKALVATSASPFSSIMSESVKAEMTAAQTDFMQSSGAATLYKSVTDTWKNATTPSTLPDAKESKDQAKADMEAAATASISGCPAILKNVFGGGSVLEKIGLEKGLPSSHIASIRGYIGDAHVFTPADTGGEFRAVYNPPCDKSNYQGMIDGTSQISSLDGTCSAASATSNLVNYVSTRLVSIANKIKTGSVMTPEEVAFLSSIPLPVWPALRAAVQVGSENMIIGKLSDVSAKGMAYQMMIDMTTRITQARDAANHMKTTKQGSESEPEKCKLEMFEQAFSMFEKVAENSVTRSKEAYDGYNTAAAAASSIESLVASLEKFSNTTRRELAARFSRGVANRATGKM